LPRVASADQLCNYNVWFVLVGNEAVGIECISENFGIRRSKKIVALDGETRSFEISKTGCLSSLALLIKILKHNDTVVGIVQFSQFYIDDPLGVTAMWRAVPRSSATICMLNPAGSFITSCKTRLSEAIVAPLKLQVE
jgi:hypothetical protein